MNRLNLHLLIAILLVGSAPLRAEETNAVSRTDYQAFRIIAERNIFNPSRSGRVNSRSQPKAAKVDSFTLVGAMAYEKGIFAFFDGSSSEFRKVAKAGDTIAGFKVTELTLKGVKLVSTNNTTIAFPIRSQMQRQDAGEWTLNAAPILASGGPSAAAADGGSSSGDDSDVLKKLMQKREQEMKNEAK